MSYNFGPPTTTAGNTFGTTTPSNGGFAFGSGDAKLLFGSTNTENKPAFNFTSPTTTAPAFGSFAFGAKTTAVTSSLFSTPATTGTGSVFGASKPLSFGGFASPPNQTVGSPGFGQPTTQNAAQNLSFGGGGIIQQQPPPAFGTTTQGGGMMQQQPPPAFGTPAPQASSAFGSPAGPGFGFGQPAVTTSAFGFSTPPSGFSAPQQPISSTTSSAPQTSQAGFPLGATQGTTNLSTSASFGQASAFGKPAPAYGFGGTTSAPSFGATTATSAAPTFGTQPASTALSLGGQQAPTAFPSPNTQQQTGMSFGKPTTGLSFGQTTAPTFGTSAPPTFGTTAPPAFGTTTTGLSFGATQATTGLSFGTPSQATTGLNFGTTTTPVSSSPSFGPPSSQPGITAAPASTAQSTGISFDKKPAGLSFGAPGSTAATTSGPSFGTPANSAQTSTGLSFGTPTSTPATTGLGFGPPASTAATTGLSFGTPASTAATTGLGFGTPASTAGTTGLGFGPPASTAATTGLGFGTPASTAATTGLSFGATTSAGLSFGTTAGTGLSFAKPTATSAASSAASLASTSGIPTLGKPTATTAMMSLTTATTTTAAVPPQPFTSISFAQLEENINKWTLELEEQEKTFINQATQINAWDRLLIANGEKIVELNDAVQTVKNDQQSLEHELDFVLAQQKELEDLLAPMEKQLLEDSADRLRDPEREHMYSLAENLDAQLKQMSEDLKEVIEHLNDTNRSQDSNDPIVQIGRILNAHMSSMQWIDNSIAQISTKLDHLKATHDTLRRDNERSFQLTYN